MEEKKINETFIRFPDDFSLFAEILLVWKKSAPYGLGGDRYD